MTQHSHNIDLFDTFGATFLTLLDRPEKLIEHTGQKVTFDKTVKTVCQKRVSEKRQLSPFLRM